MNIHSNIKDRKICMIVYSIYRLDTRVQREAEALAVQSCYEVTVLSLSEEGSPNIYRKKGVNVVGLNTIKYRGKSNKEYIYSYCKFALMAFIACTRLLLTRSIDVVHVHNMPNFLVFSALIPRIFGKKVILDIHDTMVETYVAKFGGNENKLLLKIFCFEEWLSCAFSHKLICVNHVQKDALVARGINADKITISMNVPDPGNLNYNDPSLGLDTMDNNDTFLLSYHGTIAKRLGIDLTIKAVAILTKKIAGLKFYVIGNGDDEDEFIELTKRLQVEKFVEFKEAIPLDELLDVLKYMDVGVISNRRNVATELMLPVKMLEYVALGIPVVAPRLKTIEHYFDNSMVSYFEPDNVDSLAKSIYELYKNENRRKTQSEKAKSFTKKYDWVKHKHNLIDLYNEL